MAQDNKTVWSEGMFLRPQHFQQNDRYVDWLVRSRVGGLTPYSWGLSELKINRELLMSGKFSVDSCRGILDDGTPFAIPDHADHPVPLMPGESARNMLVYLALPVRQPGGVETVPVGRDDAAARLAAIETSVFDAVAGFDSQAAIQIGRARFRFLLESDERAGYSCVGLARIVEVRSDRSIVLDDRYIPPALAFTASQPLVGYLTEIQGLLQQRG
ncbi:MAG TPA: type VI secretion system baseplate subunit TssK, partial [Stellaceae bacterium]|nr:type VI secretion system baseplate subunit TssK [Stellaceae bacterium]